MAKTREDYMREGRALRMSGKPAPLEVPGWQNAALRKGWATLHEYTPAVDEDAQDEAALPKAVLNKSLVAAFKQGMVHGASPAVKRAQALKDRRDRRTRLWMGDAMFAKRGTHPDSLNRYITRKHGISLDY
jgi:hypothetical protein